MDKCAISCIDEKRVNQSIESLPKTEEITQMAGIFKALSDPSRLKIVLALLHSELCVCELAKVCGQTDSAVSHQLRLLRTQKIVKNRRQGKIVYYTLDDDHVDDLIQLSQAHVRHE